MKPKPLSADTLFHFTNKREWLLGILKDDFYPRYCREDWSMFGGKAGILEEEAAIPMVCFCDIPLSQLSNHISTYGSYALGLKKQWGMKKRITPLLYVHDDSYTSHYLATIRESYRDKSISDIDKAAFYPLVDLLKFVKPYEGTPVGAKAAQGRVRFYDEREWRYCPSHEIRETRDHNEAEATNLNVVLYKSAYTKNGEFDRSVLDEANRTIERFALQFTPQDINYVIVSDEIERLEMAKEIENIKGDRFSANAIKVLQTKIVSVEQLQNDF